MSNVQKAKSAAQNLVSEINCLLGKCQDKKQEANMKSESDKLLSSNTFESKKFVDDPIIQLRVPRSSDEDSSNNAAVNFFIHIIFKTNNIKYSLCRFKIHLTH